MGTGKKTIIALLAAVVAIALAAVAVRGALDAHAQQQQAAATAASQQAREEETPDERAEDDMTEAQRALVDKYGASEESVTSQLSATDWASSDGKDTLSFTGRTFTETSNGEQKERIYALSKVEKAAVGNAGSSITAVMLLEDDSTIVVTLASASSQDPSSWTVHSSDFAYSEGYKPAKKTGACKASMPEGDDATACAKLFGDDAWAKTTAAVEDWAQSNCPTAAKAAWGRQATVDWGAGEVSTSFTLDDVKQTSVVATYSTKTGNVNVKKSK